jgi:hypothetical protein
MNSYDKDDETIDYLRFTALQSDACRSSQADEREASMEVAEQDW